MKAKRRGSFPVLVVTVVVTGLAFGAAKPFPKAGGYHGIWYANQPSGDKYVYKYSGGFATYPQQHLPVAVYSKEANKTFFCYGGTKQGTREQLLEMVSYYDHTTDMVPRPTILLDKQTEDAHDSPSISMDATGHIWVFCAAHGRSRPAYIYKSRKPYSIDTFDLIEKTNFSYAQPWYLPGKGFLFLYTRYRLPREHPAGSEAVRILYWMTSPNGEHWSAPHMLAAAQLGHYQISWPRGGRVGTAFNVHPKPIGLNARTNLYYLETADKGKTWRTVDGKPVSLPLLSAKNPALVRDYKSEGLLVYLKNLQYDAKGHPIIVYLTSSGYRSGPRSGPRTIWTAHWTGKRWRFLRLCETDHNYDYGSLYIESDGTWRFIAPTGVGPQPYGTGGEIEMRISRDEGRHWTLAEHLTCGSRFNHTYVQQPLHAHPDFYALWADGNTLTPSDSHLYFTNRAGDRVYRLPWRMESDFARPRCLRRCR